MMQWSIHINSTMLMKQKQHKVYWPESRKFWVMLGTLVVRKTMVAANVNAAKFAKIIQLMKS